MQRFTQWFTQIDRALTNWMAKYGVLLLRISLGIVFLWFGVLKFFPGLSPAQDLASRTIETLTFGLVQPSLSIPVLAAWECLIGLGLITGKYMRITLLLLFVQMLGTVTPIVLFPGEVFTRFPYAPTLEGQYIIKNMVLVSAALVIGATVRGGKVIADPEVVQVVERQEIGKRSKAISPLPLDRLPER
ncbi:MAG: DoxX family protein [bacterium]|nr:DoxX family protein [bacterium]